MQTDFAKSDGIKSNLRIRWPKSSDFGPKSGDSTHQIIKSKNGFGLQSTKNLAERSRYSSSTRHTKVRVRARVAIDALDDEYNHDARTLSPRLTAARLQLAVGRRGLGPREHKEGSAPSARLSWLRIMRADTQSSSSRAGLGCFVEKNTT